MYTVSTVHTCITLLECLYMCIIYIYNIYLLYVAWADQRHHQCCIRHTEQFLNGTVLYDEGPTARRLLFQGLANSTAREATRRATRHSCKLLQPAGERENRPVYLDTRCVRSNPSGAFESPTSTL